MNWLFFALLSPALFAIGNCTDKFVIEHHTNDYRGVALYVTITTFFTVLITWLLAGQPSIANLTACQVILSGMFLFGAYLLYYQAMALVSVSYIGMVFQLIPVFTLIGAVLFLQEKLHTNHVIGFILILSSCTLASLKKDDSKFKISKAFWMIIAADICFAVSTLVAKNAIANLGLLTTTCFEALGVMFGGILLAIGSAKARKAVVETIKESGFATLFILALNELLYLAAKIVGFVAIAHGPVALVGAIGGTQVFYLLIYEVTLAKLFPKFCKTDLGERSVVRQVALAGVAAFGVWIIR